MMGHKLSLSLSLLAALGHKIPDQPQFHVADLFSSHWMSIALPRPSRYSVLICFELNSPLLLAIAGIRIRVRGTTRPGHRQPNQPVQPSDSSNSRSCRSGIVHLLLTARGDRTRKDPCIWIWMHCTASAIAQTAQHAQTLLLNLG